MSPNALIRLNGIACIFGGICLMAFVLVHPWDQLLGAEIARSPQWRLAHTFHFIGAAFALVGLPGLFSQQRAALGWFGLTGFVLSFLGNAMFLGTGMITAFIWPMLAVDAPTCVEVGGPIFGSPVSVLAFALTAIILVIGYILFGIATLWAGVLPRWRDSYARGRRDPRHAAAPSGGRFAMVGFGAGWRTLRCGPDLARGRSLDEERTRARHRGNELSRDCEVTGWPKKAAERGWWPQIRQTRTKPRARASRTSSRA